MPGCLGLDAMWQLTGFSSGMARRFRATGPCARRRRSEVQGNGAADHQAGGLRRRVQARLQVGKLVLGIADGWLEADGAHLHAPAICGSACSRTSGLRKNGASAAAASATDGPRLARSAQGSAGHRPESGHRRGAKPEQPEIRSMRRVVVTGMGIVSSIGNNSQRRAGLAARSQDPASLWMPDFVEHGFRSRVGGASRSLDPTTVARPPRHALPRRRHRPGTMSPWIRPFADAGLETRQRHQQ